MILPLLEFLHLDQHYCSLDCCSSIGQGHKPIIAANVAQATTADRIQMNSRSLQYMWLSSTALIASSALLPFNAAYAQTAPVAAAPAAEQIRSIAVVGTQRLEADTVRSYIRLRTGQNWTQVAADQALKDLYATELFADVAIRNDNGAVVVEVRENPVVNRIILEGNKRLKEDKINPEIKLAPRQIYSRSKVRADVARIIELYKRQGRFAASVDPKLVQLDQNRVDIVFEITEGPKSKVQQINIIGNDKFNDGKLKGEMVTKEARITRFLSSGTSYDPDRLAFDQQKLRQFYLTQGYADFRVVSAVAELTPDKKDFIITYVVEEGERYKFGDVKVESQIRDFKSEALTRTLSMKSGDWYNAKLVEDTVESLSEGAGLFGYAFADVSPDFKPDKETRTMGITFQVAETPRVFVERVDINGNTLTQDKVVRREFRLNEGDAFNSIQVKRTADRIKSLGYFQEKLEVEQTEGASKDRIILSTNVEEKSTGELSLSAGFSSIESFIFQGAITQRNFRGKGQELRTNVSYSSYSKSANIGFTEPYLFDKSISLSADIFRSDLNSFNFLNNARQTTYKQTTTGFQLRTGVPINEFLYFQARYGLSLDDVGLDQTLYYNDLNGDGVRECDPGIAGRYLCDAIGKRTSSSLGYTLLFDQRDSRIRPTRGQSVALTQDFAGLGGDVKYIRTRFNADKYWDLNKKGFVFSLAAEGGYIRSLEKRATATNGIDNVRLTDRFYLGEPQIRGFDIRGVGPRVIRFTEVDLTNASNPVLNTVINRTDNARIGDDSLGGRAYYLARAELQLPLGTGAKELGLRPSIYVDAGAVFGVNSPVLTTLADFRDPSDLKYKNLCFGPAGNSFASDILTSTSAAGVVTNTATGRYNICPTGSTGSRDPYEERFFGNSWKPRVSIGIGVNWNSPFGPFRIDLSRALLKQEGDDTKLFSFNVGTQF
jgi:outer membrane protein insertion porin family